MRYYKDFSVTGSASSTVEDTGIQSTSAEKKKIVGIMLSVSAYNGGLVKCNVDRKEVLSIPDYIFDSYGSSGSTNVQYATAKSQFIPLDFDLEIGSTFQIMIASAGTATNLKGCYVYELNK